MTSDPTGNDPVVPGPKGTGSHSPTPHKPPCGGVLRPPLGEGQTPQSSWSRTKFPPEGRELQPPREASTFFPAHFFSFSPTAGDAAGRVSFSLGGDGE